MKEMTGNLKIQENTGRERKKMKYRNAGSRGTVKNITLSTAHTVG
jgi:hypothetical protein